MSKSIPDLIKSYKIDKKETYKLSNITLYTAINTDINEKVLIHIFPKEVLLSNANEMTFMNNQVYLMKILNHKNILQLYEIIETKTHCFLIYEYFQGMKLSDYIIKKKKLSEDDSIKIYKEILNAMIYLKEMFICNLNINSHNILIDNKNNIKICDFKFGHFYSPKEKSKSNLIGDHFSACPELHSKRPYNPELADIWSSGILLYQMVTGTLPFKSQKNLELIRLIIRGEYNMPNSLSNNMKNLIKGLLEIKEEKRIKLNDICNQQIIKDKKITKNSLTPGLNILTTKYPTDEIAINIFKNNLNIDSEILKKNLENNKFNEITSLFKQIISKLKEKGIPTINDYYSNKFSSYIKDNKNLLKEEEQINNIQNYLIKEEEVKKKSEDIAAILLNNLNEISKGLQDLKRQYDRAKKGIRPLKRNKSFGNTKNKKKKMLNLEEEKNNNNKDNENDKLKLKAVKRNTATYENIGKLILNKESKKISENKDEKKEKEKEEIKNNDKDDKKEEEKKVIEINNICEQKPQIENKEKEIEDNKIIIENKIENIDNKINEEQKIDKEEKKVEEKVREKIEKKEEEKVEKKEQEKVEKKIQEKLEKKVQEEEIIKPKKEEKKIFQNKPNLFKEQLNAVKLNKIPIKNQIEQKAKNIMLNKPKNETSSNAKKQDSNNIKIKMNYKKEDIEKEMNLLKLKKDSKNISNKNISDNKNENKPPTQKKIEPKIGGFKNIKEMIEQNLKKQRVMSNDNVKK